MKVIFVSFIESVSSRELVPFSFMNSLSIGEVVLVSFMESVLQRVVSSSEEDLDALRWRG